MQAHVSAHFLDGPTPGWMHDLLDDVLARHLTGEPIACPDGYPHGENGLMNILLDLDQEYALGIEDHGEDTFWPLPGLGLALVVQREGGVYYMLRPWTGPWRERSLHGQVFGGALHAGRPRRAVAAHPARRRDPRVRPRASTTVTGPTGALRPG